MFVCVCVCFIDQRLRNISNKSNENGIQFFFSIEITDNSLAQPHVYQSMITNQNIIDLMNRQNENKTKND